MASVAPGADELTGGPRKARETYLAGLDIPSGPKPTVKSRVGVRFRRLERFRVRFTEIRVPIFPAGHAVCWVLDLGWVRLTWGEVN